jgi:hypothetical protein
MNALSDQGLHNRGYLFGVPRTQGDICAFGREQLAGRPTYALGASGDQNILAFQSQVHRRLPP